MSISISNISQNSDQIFSILNQAQREAVNQSEKIAEINIENKLKSDASNIKGQVINLFI